MGEETAQRRLGTHRSVLERWLGKQITEDEARRMLTKVIRSLLVSYFSIVKKNLQDSVPKAIMHFLVNSVRANIQEELVIELYREDEFAEMLREADDAVRRCAAAAGAGVHGRRARRPVHPDGAVH